MEIASLRTKPYVKENYTHVAYAITRVRLRHVLAAIRALRTTYGELPITLRWIY